MAQPVRIGAGIFFLDLAVALADNRQFAHVLVRDHSGAQPVLQIVVVVGDVVGERRDLGLGAGMGGELEIVARRVLRQRPGQFARDRPVVLGEPLERLPCQVQPVEADIVALQRGDDADRLGVVVESAMMGHARLERVLPGVAEGGVAEIMGERHRLGQFLIEAQRARDGARHLRHLERMGQARPEQVALALDEDLGLLLEPAERAGVDDPVAVALKAGAEGALGLLHQPAAGGPRIRRAGCSLRRHG